MRVHTKRKFATAEQWFPPDHPKHAPIEGVYDMNHEQGYRPCWAIKSSEGLMCPDPGDWIVKTEEDGIHVYEDDAFKMEYEVSEDRSDRTVACVNAMQGIADPAAYRKMADAAIAYADAIHEESGASVAGMLLDRDAIVRRWNWLFDAYLAAKKEYGR